MQLGITREKRPDGAHWLTGILDEHADLEALARLPDQPLRLNLRGVKFINSLGMRKLIQLARLFGDRDVEFHDCPAVFVEAVNNIPLAVGGTSKIDRIKSLWLPMTCGAHATAVSIAMASIDFAKPEPELPPLSCETCFRPLAPDVDTDIADFLFFFVSELKAGA